MRVVVQVVEDAKVTINQKEVAKIDGGYLLFVGFTHGDNKEKACKMASKIAKLRLFPDESGKTNLNIFKVNGSILSISQFTLYASVKDGNRPSFSTSMPGSESEQLYDAFNKALRDLGLKVETGVFGENMDITFTNKGPFTLLLDSEELYGE